MSNSFYEASGTPGIASFGASSAVRSEFLAIQAGFDKMPALSLGVANCAVVVNSGGTGLTNTVGSLALAADFFTVGGFGTTLQEQGVTTLTLPAVSGTLATLAGTEVLTNKTLNGMTMEGSGTVNFGTGGTVLYTGSSITLAGDVTGPSGSNEISDIQGQAVGGVTGTGNVVFSINPTITGTLTAATANFSGNIAGGGNSTANANASLNSATGNGNGSYFSILGAGALKSAFGTFSALEGAGTDQSAMLISYADNVWLNAATSGKSVLLAVNSTPIINASATEVIISQPINYGGVLLNNSVTGTDSMVLSTSPILTTPNLGTPSALVLTNATGTPTSIGLANGTALPISTGVSGLGSGVATLLGGSSSGTGGVAGTANPTFSGTLAAATITATGNITAYFSDDRLKDYEGAVEDALAKIMSLDVRYYKANKLAQSMGLSVARELGLSAQQVLRIEPDANLVRPAPINNDYLTLDYPRTLVLTLAAVQELNRKVDRTLAA